MAAPRLYCDINADLGESYGAWKMGDDAALLEVVSSCNIACGFHAGDPLTIERTVALAVARGVAIGAHPSLPDLAGFGRREMAVSARELHAITLYQVAALAGFARVAGVNVHHVKPHGALYSMLERDAGLAGAFAAAVRGLDGGLLIYGPPQGALRAACVAADLRYIAEGFADRGYMPSATLVPRADAGALLAVEPALAQGVQLAMGEAIATVAGTALALDIDTLCVHGDGAHALELARRLRARVEQAGITVRAP